jgi:hypothetical protein
MEDEQRTGTEWEVIKIESETVITQTPWNSNMDTETSTTGIVTIRITVQRKSKSQNIILMAPLIGMYTLQCVLHPILGFLNTQLIQHFYCSHILSSCCSHT